MASILLWGSKEVGHTGADNVGIYICLPLQLLVSIPQGNPYVHPMLVEKVAYATLSLRLYVLWYIQVQCHLQHRQLHFDSGVSPTSCRYFHPSLSSPIVIFVIFIRPPPHPPPSFSCHSWLRSSPLSVIIYICLPLASSSFTPVSPITTIIYTRLPLWLSFASVPPSDIIIDTCLLYNHCH